MLCDKQNLVSLIYIDIWMALQFEKFSMLPNLFFTMVTKDEKIDPAQKKAFSIISLTS